MTLEERPQDNAVRGQINNVLDLCNPAQWELSLRIVKAIHEQGPTTTTSLDQTAL
jgi:hypothetical protein